MRFVIVTGMSGAGKSTALRTLEDLGFYCVDNLPVDLIGDFADIMKNGEKEYSNIAVGIDARNSKGLARIESVMKKLMKKEDFTYEILFLDADDTDLIKRFKKTRREHPLARKGDLQQGISSERNLLKYLRDHADYMIDTTNETEKDLRIEIGDIFSGDTEDAGVLISVTSFGYKYGIPRDADYVFDVRFMPNPYYIHELREHTGDEQIIRDYVMNSDESHEFISKLFDMIDFLIPHFKDKEGRRRLVIAIGCTGGRHRSVTVANLLSEHLASENYIVIKNHRDISHG